eukprot:TRINITY_DN24013_c0_g1_i1.p1 TRINITY_DN24013_c0_g1~~TRINITY_DN24013_c0_g1_i1.p1  ORF type:complete len:617 (+),score=200.98 TRINITY_DN24013_c0_g1_i1:41-1891(+)
MTDKEAVSKAEDVQKRSFTKWVNVQLKKGDHDEEVTDLAEDLKTGIVLLKVLASTTGQNLPPYNKVCKSEIQRVSNQSIVIDFFQSAKIKLIGIGPQDLADGNMRAMLAAMWAIIYAQQIGAIKGEASGKAGLLLWVKRAVGSYDLQVTDFKKSWSSGLVLTALIHKYKPNALSFTEAADLSPGERVQKCIDVAQKDLGIEPLIDASDMEHAIDEKAIMTYISEFFALFSKVQDKEVAQRRVVKFFETQRTIENFQVDYETKTSDVLEFILEAKSQMEGEPEGLVESRKFLDKVNEFRSGPLAEKRVVKESLEGILSNLQTTLSCHQRASYTPSDDQTLDNVETQWSALEEAANKHLSKTRDAYVKAKQDVTAKYLEVTQEGNTQIGELASSLRSLTGDDPAKLLKKAKEFKKTAEPLLEIVEKAAKLGEELQQANVNVDDIAGLEVRADDLERAFADLTKNINKKCTFLENQVESKKGSTVSADKLAEIKETFDHFDSNNSGTLTGEDFDNALKGLGRNLSDIETTKLFKSSISGSSMTFDEFVAVMTKMEADADTPEEILSSIASLQGEGEGGLTKEALVASLGEETAAYFINKLPEKDGKYDFASYLQKVYKK